MSWIARCNGQSVFGNACNTVASLTKNFLAFATPLQIEKTTLGPLHQWCKSQKPLLGPCTDGASTSKNVLAPRVTSVEALYWLHSYIELALRRSARGFDTQADGLDAIQLFVAHTLTDP